MTYKEICREFDKINRDYFLRTIHKTDEKKIRQYLRNHRDEKNVYFKPVICRVDNNSQYITIPHTPDYNTYKKVGLHGRSCLVFSNRHGLNTVMLGGERDEFYLIITSHFYNRFNERLFHDESASKMDLIIQCLNCINYFVLSPFPLENHPNNYIGVTEELIVFAERVEHNIVLVKTCVTSEQLFSSREGKANSLKEDLIEYIKYWEQVQQHYLNASRKRIKLLRLHNI